MRIANGVVAVSIVASAMMSACAGARAGSPPWPVRALVTTSAIGRWLEDMGADVGQ